MFINKIDPQVIFKFQIGLENPFFFKLKCFKYIALIKDIAMISLFPLSYDYTHTFNGRYITWKNLIFDLYDRTNL